MADQPRRIWPPPMPPHPHAPHAEGFSPGSAPGSPTGSPASNLPLRDRVIAALREVFDPEIPINIYDLGLVYRLDIDEAAGKVAVDLTLTTPNCPEAEAIPGRVRSAIEKIPDVKIAEVELIWDPPWDKSRMSEDARLVLGIE